MEINILLFILLFAFDCNQKQSNEKGLVNSVENSITHNINDTLLQYTTEWKRDSLGCLKLRTKEKAESIIRILKNANIHVLTMYKNFGSPNEQQIINEKLILIYYFDCVCNNGHLVMKSDKCYAKFYLKSDSLYNLLFSC